MMKLQCKILYVFAVVLLSLVGCSDNRSLEEKFEESVELGMSSAEVRDIMGEPDSIETYSSGTTWEYSVKPIKPPYTLYISFHQGIVDKKWTLI